MPEYEIEKLEPQHRAGPVAVHISGEQIKHWFMGHASLNTAAMMCDLAAFHKHMEGHDKRRAASAELLASIEELVEHFSESHATEIDAEHYGDDTCSYCDAIARAKAAIAAANEQAVTS